MFGGQDYALKSVQQRVAGRGEKPPQFAGLPSSVTVKAGETITFTAKVCTKSFIMLVIISCLYVLRQFTDVQQIYIWRTVSFFFLLKYFLFSGRIIAYLQATGHPLPRLMWRRSDGTPISSGGRYKVELSPDGTTKLIIEKCIKDDTDTYLCVAENEGGAVQSRCSLNVIGMHRSCIRI